MGIGVAIFGLLNGGGGIFDLSMDDDAFVDEVDDDDDDNDDEEDEKAKCPNGFGDLAIDDCPMSCDTVGGCCFPCWSLSLISLLPPSLFVIIIIIIGIGIGIGLVDSLRPDFSRFRHFALVFIVYCELWK